MTKHYFFRTECSPKLGIGHFMRCISLANELIINKNNKVTFVYSNKFINNYKKFSDKKIKFLSLKKKINSDNFKVISDKEQKKDATEFIKIINSKSAKVCVILDSYSLDYIWEKEVRKCTNKLIVIDDLANRKHYCDYLIDQTINRKRLDYKKYLLRPSKLLLGSKYCIIRRQFKGLSINKNPVKNIFKRLNISFGNFDEKNLLLRSLVEIEKSNFKFERIDVFISKFSKNFKKVSKFKNQSKISFQIFSDNKLFPKMLSNASLCIGAGGTTSWERCLMLIPSIVINAADNQKNIIKQLKKEKLIYYAGNSESKKLNIVKGINYYNNQKNLKLFKNKAKQTFDINGIKRIIQKISK